MSEAIPECDVVFLASHGGRPVILCATRIEVLVDTFIDLIDDDDREEFGFCVDDVLNRLRDRVNAFDWGLYKTEDAQEIFSDGYAAGQEEADCSDV